VVVESPIAKRSRYSVQSPHDEEQSNLAARVKESQLTMAINEAEQSTKQSDRDVVCDEAIATIIPPHQVIVSDYGEAPKGDRE
jgi:hypothetical protein